MSAWKHSHGFSQTTGALLRGMAKDIVWNRRGAMAAGMTGVEAFYRNPDQMDFSDPVQNLIICTLFGPFK